MGPTREAGVIGGDAPLFKHPGYILGKPPRTARVATA